MDSMNGVTPFFHTTHRGIPGELIEADTCAGGWPMQTRTVAYTLLGVGIGPSFKEQTGRFKVAGFGCKVEWCDWCLQTKREGQWDPPVGQPAFTFMHTKMMSFAV